AWGRLSQTRNVEGGTRNRKTGPIRTTPVALFRRERGAIWRSLSTPPDTTDGALSHTAGAVLGVLDERGASFFGDLVNATGLLRTEVEKGPGELVAWGLVTSDRFAGLRALLVPWRDLLRVYRRLEARGEIRGGRFVGGFSGEQYALPEAVGLLRSVRRQEPSGALVTLSGADPLNLVGIITPGDAVTALATNRILYRDGIPVAVREG